MALFAQRPAPILGVNGEALGRSVIGGFFVSPCDKRPGGAWRCKLYVGLYDEQPNAVYRVEVHGLGCWSATLVGGELDFYAKHRSGCLTIVDYVFA